MPAAGQPSTASSAPEATAALDDFEAPAAVPPLVRISAGDLIADGQDESRTADGGSPSDRLLGVVVHRMFEHAESLCGPRMPRSDGRGALPAAAPGRGTARARGSRGVRGRRCPASGFERTRATDVREALARPGPVLRSAVLAPPTRADRARDDRLPGAEGRWPVLVVELKTGRPRPGTSGSSTCTSGRRGQLHGNSVPVSGLLLYL